jgi:Spy/CpxP family protein refolding chaperone
MRRLLLAPASLLAVALAVACSKSASTGTPDAAPDRDAPASSAAEALGGSTDGGTDAAPVDAAPPPVVVHHARGIPGMFFRAAYDLPELTDDEKAAIDKVEDPIKGSESSARHELNNFRLDVASGLKANRFDSAKLQADEAAYAKALAGRQDEQATALNSLHQALTADQRKAVAESLKAAQASHDKPPAPVSDAGASEWAAHRLERMKSQLVLDMDQQKEVAAVLAKNGPPSASTLQSQRDSAKRQVETLIAAFEKDAFDAKKLDLSVAPGRKPTAALEAQVKYLTQLMPVLTAGQRDRLAASIEHPREMKGRTDSIAEPFEPGGTGGGGGVWPGGGMR